MSKKFIIFLVFAGLLLFQAPAKSQEIIELPEPGITPDSSFYFLKTIFESIGTFLTFDDNAKAERYAELAARRIAEAKSVIEKGKPEAAERVLNRYRHQLEKSLGKAEEIQRKGKSASDVVDRVARATANHLVVLEEVLDKVPEQAKQAILQARNVSLIGQIRALESLSEEQPEKALELQWQSMEGRLERVRNRIQARDEGAIERTLNDFNVLRNSFGKISKEEAEVLAVLASEKFASSLINLDAINEELEEFSPQLVEKMKEIKAGTIEGQIGVLKSFAQIEPEKAAEIFSQAAEQRLGAAKKKAEERNIERVEEIIKEFEKYASFGQEISEIAKKIGKDSTQVEELVAKATARHLEVLSDVYNRAPEQAKEAIKEAMTVSEVGRQKAVEALKEKGALKEIPETAPIFLPLDVKTKAQERMGQKKEGVIRPEIIEIEIPEKEEIKKPEIEIEQIPDGQGQQEQQEQRGR